MAVPAATIADFAPWGNAELAFEIPNGAVSVDPTTGNTVVATETVDYLAHLTMEPSNWKGQTGADASTYSCRGRLLSPVELDRRITNGSQAVATVNGARGRFELVFDLAMVQPHRSDLRQQIQGVFRVVGGVS